MAPVAHPWLDYYRSFGEGLAAVALSTEDADATARALGLGAEAPMDLSRPVEGGVARFRLVRLDQPYVFVCQHLTRELVWRPQWRNAGELESVSLPMKQPFAGTPPNIEWNGPPVLRIQGKAKAVETHGVRLEFV